MISSEPTHQEGLIRGLSHGCSVPVWFVISCHENNRLRFLNVPAFGGDALLVFSTGPAALDFAEHSSLAQGWHVRETTAGELISILLSRPEGARQVALDPCAGLDGPEQEYTGREEFIAALMGEPLLAPAK